MNVPFSIHSILSTLFIGTALVLFAQNLVPNPSFELISGCPATDGELHFADNWNTYLFSPDLWHACGDSGNTGVPYNIYSYQEARTGVGYSGFLAFSPQGQSADGFREFPGVQLSDTLEIGQEYHVEMYVSWSTAADGMQGSVQFANNNIGALFSTQERFGFDWYPLPNFAHVLSSEIITDSIGWTLIEGNFIADSAYAFVFFGNFYGDLETNDTLINPTGQFGFSYYFIDDICVREANGTCSTVNIQSSNVLSVKIGPNPFSEFISISVPFQGEVPVRFCNNFGQLVYSRTIHFNNSRTTVQLPELAAGPYYLTLDFKDLGQQRVLLIHE